MNTYTIEVLNDSDEADDGLREPARFTIHTREVMDLRLLQVVGLFLDGGISPQELRDNFPTAAYYATAENVQGETQSSKWITAALGNETPT